MAARGENEEDELLQPGKVEKVKREWSVFEDGALAMRLQNEEFYHHYDQNRSERQLMRLDVSEARHAQTDEEEEATRRIIEHHQQLLRIEQEDERLARQLQEQLDGEVNCEVKQVEDADEELARRLQQKEERRYHLHKERKRLARERKRVEEEISRQDLAATQSACLEPGVDDVTNSMQHVSLVEGRMKDRYDEVRLFNTMVAPSLPLTGEQRQRLLQQEDEHLARLIQQRENEPTQATSGREGKDLELARIMQEEEMLKAKRRKEKLKQMQVERDQRLLEGDGEGLCGERRDHHPSPPTPPPPLGNTTSELIVNLPLRECIEPPQSLHTPGGTVPNIALQIDPTYQRSLHSPPLNTTHHTGESCSHSPVSSQGRRSDPVMDRNYVAAIPGQRRTLSLDKRRQK